MDAIRALRGWSWRACSSCLSASRCSSLDLLCASANPYVPAHGVQEQMACRRLCVLLCPPSSLFNEKETHKLTQGKFDRVSVYSCKPAVVHKAPQYVAKH